MAQRLGMPLAVIAAARGFLSDDQKRLQAHLDRVDAQARALDAERDKLDRERRAAAEQRAAVEQRERQITEREEALRKRLNEKLDDRLRQARRDIDSVIEQLKEKSEALVEKASSVRAAGTVLNTGQSGAAKAEARAALDRIVEGLKHPSAEPAADAAQAGPLVIGSKVAVGMGLEGTVVQIHGSQVEVDVRGKRMRAKTKDVRVLGGPSHAADRPVARARQRRSAAARRLAQRDQRDRLHRG